MAEHYTDEDLLNVRLAIDEWNEDHRDERPLSQAILNAVAPAIAARALREFADNKVTIQTPARVIEDMHDRADEIEAQS